MFLSFNYSFASVLEVLVADLVESVPIEWCAELKGVILRGAENILQRGILASRDVAVVVEILDVEGLLDGSKAGGTVSLCSNDIAKFVVHA